MADISILSNNIAQSMKIATDEVEEMLQQAQRIYDVLESMRKDIEDDDVTG